MIRASAGRVGLRAGLALLVVAIYGQCLGHEFILFDDPSYVSNNPIVRHGLTWDGIVAACTRAHSANWHPLTWWAHMLDVQLFGLDAGAHAMSNVVLHIGAAFALLAVLGRLTGSSGIAAVVTFVFAVHPANVENVAWVSEKKSVLSALCGFLAIGAYLEYTKENRLRAYWKAVVWYGLSLAAKPMLVTLPLLLLLVDWWPLQRHKCEPTSDSPPDTAARQRRLRRILGEKVPFAVLAAASCIITGIVQYQAGAMGELDRINWPARLGNAVSSYWLYLDKLLVPRDHAVLYPFPAHHNPYWGAAGLAGLIGLTWAVLHWRRKAPWLAFGWLWYLATLLPVIGLVQVGSQSMADRYLYIPMIGLLVGILASIHALPLPARFRRTVPLFATGWIAALSVAAWSQTSCWTNSETLFRQSLANTRGNFLLHGALGHYMQQHGRLPEAEAEFRAGLAIRPTSPSLLANYATLLTEEQRPADGIQLFEAAAKHGPLAPPLRLQLAVFYFNAGRLEESAHLVEEVLAAAPETPDARRLAAAILARKHRRSATPGQQPMAP